MSTLNELREILLHWRRCELATSEAVLTACLPNYIARCRQEEAQALNRLRQFVDREPWSALTMEMDVVNEFMDRIKSTQK